MKILFIISIILLCLSLIVFIFAFVLPKGRIKEKNIQIEKENKELEKINEELKRNKLILTDEKNKIQNDIQEQQSIYNQIKENDKQSIQDLHEANLNLANKNFEAAMLKLRDEYLSTEEQYKKDYNTIMSDLVNTYVEKDKALNEEYSEKLKRLQEQTNSLTENLEKLKNTVDAGTEALKRLKEEADKKDYYRLIISEDDLEEINLLREIEPKLKDPMPLNKVIWKVYYEKPYTDLIGRVVGPIIKTGIYKITNMENGMSYVGQAKNISQRWSQHIKRGLGAEAPTKNKLYPALRTFGVENFTWEIIEECPPDQLNEREDYWQEFFHCKDFGYSIK